MSVNRAAMPTEDVLSPSVLRPGPGPSSTDAHGVDGEPPEMRQPIADSIMWRAFALAGAAVTTVIGTVVLTGWLFGIDALTHPLIGATKTQPSTALALTLIGVAALILAARGARTDPAGAYARRAAFVIATAAAVVGVVMLVERVFDVGTGLNALLVDAPAGTGRDVVFGRATVLVASLAIGSGAALMLSACAAHRWSWMRQLLALSVVTIGYFTVLSYVYSANVLLDVDLRALISPYAALAFLLTGAALLCLAPEDGWMRTIAADAVGGKVARRMLPAVIAGIPLIGLVRVIGVREGWWDDRLGAALGATAIVAMLIVAVLVVAELVNRQHDRLMIAESARRRAHALAGGLFDATDAVMMVFGVDGRVLMMNKAAARARDVSSERVLGRRIRDVLPPDEAALREAMIRRVVETGERLSEEIASRRAGGQMATMRAEMIPIVDESGAVLAVGTIATDATESKLRRERLDLLNRDLESEIGRAEGAASELEAFAHTLSHDLRSPLRAIDGFAQVLVADYAHVIKRRGLDHLERIRAGAAEMTTLIDGMLDFSRIGRTQPRLVDVDMTAAARGANEQLGYEREGRDVRVLIHDLPPARADPSLVGVVFANLLSNAHKYTRTRAVAEIEVGAQVEPGRPTIYFVRDNGIGFDMKDVGKLFGPFKRMHAAREYEGTGVGMATVQRIVRRHGGKVWADSEPGVGTTISFQLAGDVEIGPEGA